MTDSPQNTPSAPTEGEPAGADLAYRGRDRRTRHTPRLSRHSLWGGRRKIVRRDVEREGSYVDLYSGRLLFLLGWVALMNSADSFFTIYHLQVGGIELNPVAAWLLAQGRYGFVFAKSTLIMLSLIVLCVHKNFYLARLGVLGAAATYTVLVGYHLWLL